MLESLRTPRRGGGHAASAAGPRAGCACIIMNPAAGKARARQLRTRIENAFRRAGAEFEISLTHGPGHATELARAATARGCRLVCAVGGDGTLAETASALAGSGTPLALIPRGTANQVAFNLGIPRHVEAAVQVALHGRMAELDVGVIDGRVFTLAAGAGLDAAVMARATPALKERWGFGAYVYAMLKESVTSHRRHFDIVADGRDLHVGAMSVLIANVGALYTAFPNVRMPMAPEPDSAWRDGMLDVVIVEPASVPRFAGLLARLAVVGFGGAGLLHLRAREVELHAVPSAPLQIDGDAAGETPVTAVALPAALRIMVPRTTL